MKDLDVLAFVFTTDYRCGWVWARVKTKQIIDEEMLYLESMMDSAAPFRQKKLQSLLPETSNRGAAPIETDV